MTLVLSLFPGGGVLDHAFGLEGFCVVRGPDPLWGGDIRTFHPPDGRFDGIIGGDPCQSHSSLANLVRAKGLEPSFPDLGPEYERVVNEARPAWFLRENVPQAPDIKPDGYDIRTFMLDNSTIDSGDGWGNEQMRRRRFWFGVRDGAAPELRQWIRFALRELPTIIGTVRDRVGSCGPGLPPGTLASEYRTRQQVVAADSRAVPVAIGGSGKRKVTACSTDGRHGHRIPDGTGGTVEGVNPPRRTLEEMLRLQGMPLDWFKHSPFTVTGKRKIVGNAVSVPMGRELAQAIRLSMAEQTKGGA